MAYRMSPPNTAVLASPSEDRGVKAATLTRRETSYGSDRSPGTKRFGPLTAVEHLGFEVGAMLSLVASRTTVRRDVS